MATDGSKYFADNYFADSYWNEDYWFDDGAVGNVFGTDIPTVPVMVTVPSLARGINSFMVRVCLFIIGGTECLES